MADNKLLKKIITRTAANTLLGTLIAGPVGGFIGAVYSVYGDTIDTAVDKMKFWKSHDASIDTTIDKIWKSKESETTTDKGRETESVDPASEKNPLKNAGIQKTYHIVDEKNLRTILEKGLLSRNEMVKLGIDFKDVSDPEIQQRRINVKNYDIHDYASMYFNPRNAMLYRLLKEEGKNIAILEIDTDFILHQKGDDILISNKNAAVVNAMIMPIDLIDLNSFIDKNKVFSTSWAHYTLDGYKYVDKDRKQKMQAEILCKKRVGPKWITGCFVQDQDQEKRVRNLIGLKTKITIDYPKKFYF